MPETSVTSLSTSAPQGNYEWVNVYTRLADKLLEFKQNRPALIEHIKNAFAAAEMKLPTLERNGHELTDICPFTVFGLFNKRLTDDNRKKILSNLLRELKMELQTPSSFDGIPVLNPQMATFYWFAGERDDMDIPNLWQMFDGAIEYAESPTKENEENFIRLYNQCKKQKGVNWNLSMGLFWIRPLTYLSLDGRNRWFIETDSDLSKIPNPVKENQSDAPSAADYLRITEQVRHIISGSSRYDNFVSFSHYAWMESERINQERKSGTERKLLELSVVDGQYHVDIDVTAEEWVEMLQLSSIFNEKALQMVLTWYQCPGHQSSTKEVMERLHPSLKGSPYNGIVKSLGKSIIAHLNRFEVKRKDTNKGTYWCIPFEGWYDENDQFIWKLRKELVQAIEELGLAESPAPEADMMEEEAIPSYGKEEFLQEVYLSEGKYDELLAKLKQKKNIILQGAPGVGKTYSARRLAWSMMGCKDDTRIMMIQFHQSYSYEDFIMGYRPNGSDFVLKYGPFYQFCKEAAADTENDYFFIIDEINRGNLSKIFGELFMLMESHYRGSEHAMPLLYSDERFYIPKNLYIIGMMNTADRSLAMLDYALRRRFAFFELEPAFRTEGFVRFLQSAGNKKLEQLIQTIEQLNAEICRDDSLGKGFRIGHSYFCLEDDITDEHLQSIINYELIPLLEEYWFDETDKVENWSRTLISSIK